MAQKVIYLVRHGRIELQDNQRRYIGQIDLPLNDKGKEQARLLAQRLSQIKIEAVYCSDLSRSVDTAKEIAARHDLFPLARADLREVSLGKWEGLKFAEVASRFPKEFRERGVDIGYFRPPGGESFSDCQTRVVEAFHEILSTSFEKIAIVGHAGVNRLLICHMLGMQLANLFRISQDYACLNIIQADEYGFRLKLLNGLSS